MIVNTLQVQKVFDGTIPRCMMLTVRRVAYPFSRLRTVTIDGGNRHGRHSVTTQVVEIDTDVMIDHYTLLIASHAHKHLKAKMITARNRWLKVKAVYE